MILCADKGRFASWVFTTPCYRTRKLARMITMASHRSDGMFSLISNWRVRTLLVAWYVSGMPTMWLVRSAKILVFHVFPEKRKRKKRKKKRIWRIVVLMEYSLKMPNQSSFTTKDSGTRKRSERNIIIQNELYVRNCDILLRYFVAFSNNNELFILIILPQYFKRCVCAWNFLAENRTRTQMDICRRRDISSAHKSAVEYPRSALMHTKFDELLFFPK